MIIQVFCSFTLFAKKSIPYPKIHNAFTNTLYSSSQIIKQNSEANKTQNWKANRTGAIRSLMYTGMSS